MSRRELLARLALRALPRMREEERVALLLRHGSACGAVRLLETEPARAAALRSPLLQRRVAAAERAVERLGVAVLSPCDDAFPTLPEPIAPPAVLFARGDLTLLARPGVAVVGTRRCTEYGEDVAHELAGTLARAGVVVISGLARGIDAVAHRAALAAGGGTIGVLGCGIDVVYPREHGALHEEIACAGLLLSEFLPGEPPRPHHFLQRNRLIAGYARATVVVEGGRTSGAINTAHHALAAGSTVFGVPGPLGRGTSDGPVALLRDGAHVYTGPADILFEIGAPCRVGSAAGPPADAPDAAAAGTGTPPELLPGLSRDAGRLVGHVLRRDAKHIDTIVAAAAGPAADTLSALLELEMAGVVEQLPGMRFRLARRRQA
jgi:DNA processing protein